MAYFNDPADVHHFMGGIFTECLTDPELAPKLAASGVTLALHYTDPGADVLVDMVNGKVFTGAECAAGPKPNVEMFMAADVGHEYWLGKVNVSMALARGQMRAKGPVPKILKLVPLTKKVFPKYRQMIEESGRAELLGA
jgi:hypothetical protein